MDFKTRRSATAIFLCRLMVELRRFCGICPIRDAVSDPRYAPMKFRLLVPIVMALILCAAALPSVARRDDSGIYGQPAPPSASEREILIDPNTRYVNVARGETVNFRVGGNTFAWQFNGVPNRRVFDLRDIAPQDTLDRPVTVYVAPGPDERD
jgi:hypothetical protein